MALPRDRIHDLLREVCSACPEEFNCQRCLEELARLAERESAGACETLRAVEQHIASCAECREEFEVLREALRALRGPDGPCTP